MLPMARPSWPLTDDEIQGLLLRVAQRDESALEALHRATSRQVQSCVRCFESNEWNVEEILQDVYKHIWMNAATYAPIRGTPGSWIYMIARSRSVDNLRRGWKAKLTLDLADCYFPVATGDLDGAHMQKWRCRVVQRMLAGLPEAQNSMIQMSFFEGLSHREIAEQTGLPLGTIKSRIRTAISAMRQVLQLSGVQ